MSKAYLERLLAHTAWANGRVLDCLRAAPTPERRALRLFSHLLTAEQIYLARMRGQDPWPQDFWPELSLAECAALITENRTGYAAFFATLTEEGLRTRVRYRNSQGLEFRTPIEDMLMHVALHSVYHRGQISAALRVAGEEPVNTDFITFVREGD